MISGRIYGAYQDVLQVNGSLQTVGQYLSNQGSGGGGLGVFESNGIAGIGSAGILTSKIAGQATLVIPTAGVILSAQIQINESSELDEDGNFAIVANFNGAQHNSSWSDAISPCLSVIDSGGNQRAPGDIGLTVQTATPATGNTTTTVFGVNGVGFPLRLKFTW